MRRALPRAWLSISLLLCACRAPSGGAPSSSSSVALSASAEALDVKLPLPSFVLVDQHGDRFDSAAMRGKVWIVDFIFTTCPTICPELTKRMSDLVAATEGDADVRFLSISVDPENDTPPKLASFVEKNGVPSPRWSLVTGDPKVISETVLHGFKIAAGKDAAGNLFHGEHFVVVDKEGRVRGFFPASDGPGLLRRARELAR